MPSVEEIEKLLKRFKVTRRPGDFPAPDLIITLKDKLDSDHLWSRFIAIRSS